jgi:recombinational DNA repair protein (RecF pathway)
MEARSKVTRLVAKIKRSLLGRTADHCAECGRKVDPASEFRVLTGLVYCSEEHAVADQQNNPL